KEGVRGGTLGSPTLMVWPVTLPGSRVASTKRCKDAGSGNSPTIDATEDAAARSVIAGRGPGGRCRTGLLAPGISQVLFIVAVRDNVVRWAARDAHPAPLVAGDITLAAATAVMVAYVLAARRDRIRHGFTRSLAAFAPAGIALTLAYDSLLEAFDRGRVSIV